MFSQDCHLYFDERYIEKGFEKWADNESGKDDETIDEKGVDSSEEIDFNVVPRF